MKGQVSVRFRIWMVLTTLAGVVAGLTLPGLSDSTAQISLLPTPTFTAFVPTDTPTPAPPTDTPTPAPPTSTPTPAPLPPELGRIEIDPPEALAAVGTSLDFTTVFTDPGLGNYLNFAIWDWGDGTSSSCPPSSADCTVDLGDGMPGSDFIVVIVNGSHAYSEPGTYVVQLTVADSFGQFDTSVFEFVVVYDPSAGFVTGAGWIDSQPGAYKPDPTRAGKATFAFVSKYQNGANAPTGNTKFQFRAGDLSFDADSYDWLVVSRGGSRAQFKGSGTVNGASDPNGNAYRFMLWAEDGSPDTFRIRIWWEDGSGEIVVYDNGFSQPIGGGSIVVHLAG